MDEKINIKEVLESTKNILKIISETNDTVIKTTEDLRIVLLNLKIENAHIKENTGIVPISNELEKIIKQLHSNVENVVKNYRKELQDNFKIIENRLI